MSKPQNDDLFDEDLDEDVNLDDEDVDDDADDEDDSDDSDDEDSDDDDDDSDSDDDDEDSKKKSDKKDAKNTDNKSGDKKNKPLFDQKQQKEVDRIVKARLERHESKLVKGYSDAAGVEISAEEVGNATRLWGLLKANPQLSKAIDAVIAEQLTKGLAKEPAAKSEADIKNAELVMKEAILDLKVKDATFNKYADKILDWAENEGLDVTDAKTLKLAYLAWKATQGKIAEASQKKKSQQKNDAKKQDKARAKMQSPKSGKHGGGKSDYSKMSETAILAKEGLSLFTDD